MYVKSYRDADRVRSGAAISLLKPGGHHLTRDGVCLMEYVSVRCGERFTDHPLSTDPSLASLARSVNGSLSDRARHQLAPRAGELVNTRARGAVERHVAVAAAVADIGLYGPDRSSSWWLAGSARRLRHYGQASRPRWRSAVSSFARRAAPQTRITTHEDRIDWLRGSLVDDPDTLSYRVAATLLLLYALPVTRVAALRRGQISTTPAGTTIMLGGEPAAVPAPFAELLDEHLAQPPHRRGADTSTVWVSPGVRAGQHLHPNTRLIRLRDLGIDLRSNATRSCAASPSGSRRRSS